MTIQYGTATAERVICRTPRDLRVGFLTKNDTEGTETVYTLHPVTREIRVRTGEIGANDQDELGWREGHHVPPGAEYIGRCEWPSVTKRVWFEV